MLCCCLVSEFFLFSGSCETYFYTSQGENCQIDGVDDDEDFLKTVAAFDLLGISSDLQKSIFKVFAGLLLLGNIGFDPQEEATTLIVSCVMFFLFILFCTIFHTVISRGEGVLIYWRETFWLVMTLLHIDNK